MEIRLDPRARFTRGRALHGLPAPTRVDARVGAREVVPDLVRKGLQLGERGDTRAEVPVGESVGVPADQQTGVAAAERGVIGILGGTFDPIHVGHIALARAALRELKLAEVRFVPAAQPWQKSGVTDAAHRARMVQLAIAGEARCVLDRHEIEHGGASYTVDSLRAARASLGDAVPIVLIIGSDQMRTLDTWHQWQSLPTLAHLAVALRGQAVLALSCALQAFYKDRK